MAYVTLAEVKPLISKIEISDTTTLSTTEAEWLIRDVEAEVNAALSVGGYTVPATTPDWFFAAVQSLVKYGAAAAILKSVYPDVTGTAETPAYAFWEKRYQDGLSGIRSGEGVPAIADNPDNLIATTYLTQESEEVDLGEIAEPFFKRSMIL